MLAAAACTDATAPRGPQPSPLAPVAVEIAVASEIAYQPVEGAQVLLTARDGVARGTRHGALTDAHGHARFPAIPAGTYDVMVRRIGYVATTTTMRATTRGAARVDSASTAGSEPAATVRMQVSLATGYTCNLGASVGGNR